MYRSARLLALSHQRTSRVFPPLTRLHGRSTLPSAPSSRSAMISFQPRNHAVDQARRAAVRRVADWVEQALPEEQRDATHVMVNQVECREEGCPPVECVIALLRKQFCFRRKCSADIGLQTVADQPRSTTPKAVNAL